MVFEFRDEETELEDVGYDEYISKNEVVEDAVFGDGTITSKGEEFLLKNHSFTRRDVVDEESVGDGFIEEVVDVGDADLVHGEDAIRTGYVGDGEGARYDDFIVGDCKTVLGEEFNSLRVDYVFMREDAFAEG